MIVPAIVIRLELEARPQVQVVALHAGDELRLADWIGARPELVDLVERACQLADERRAA